MGTFIDITGKKFGKLTVLKRSDKTFGAHILWDCVCECGGLKTTRAGDLKNGKTLSCGCNKTLILLERNTTHGMSYSRLHGIWRDMKKRCLNPNSKGFPHYGGRGIGICERWLESFENFYNDVKEGYKDNLSLDRYPDTDGNYEPSNFRWATFTQQQNNKRNNHILVFNGISATVAEWADIIGVKKGMLYRRLGLGWSVQDVLTIGKKQKKTNNDKNGI